MEEMGDHDHSGTGPFSREVSGLPTARSTPTVRLADGDQLDLRIAAVAQPIGDTVVRMLAYNGSIPGPTLRVRQGSEIVVNVTNDGDVEATVHWHGLRLENRFDGVPHDTQKPIPVGDRYTYQVQFPDEGLYWYHPHLREDYAQDMGLYGSIVVEPRDPDYWPPVDRDVVLAVDDVLIEDGQVAPYDRSGPDHVAMGRFGNVLLVNGQPTWALDVHRGEVVRFHLTNTANTRIFDVVVNGGVMKLVGGDSGRYERETLVESVLLSPSERAVVDVLFDRPGDAALEHRTPERTYRLGGIRVRDARPSEAAERFHTLRQAPELEAERVRTRADLAREPDKIVAIVAEMTMEADGPPAASDPVAPRFACPMDPEVVSVEPSRCPKCGMKLLPIALVPAALERLQASPGGHTPVAHGKAGDHETRRIEWHDDMEATNRRTTPANMRWLLVDRHTGRSNAAIDWAFAVGDRVKIRLVNEVASDHPMPHPFHIHGAGRFLILARDGKPEPNLVWKDTVLVRTGEVVDILLDVSNRGLWMAHCHISEHIESGMMFHFRVAQP